MSKCSFCGMSISQGTGKMHVRKDGRIFNFCSSKCERSQLVLHRRPRSVRWTSDARAAKEERKHAAEADSQEKKVSKTPDTESKKASPKKAAPKKETAKVSKK